MIADLDETHVNIKYAELERFFSDLFEVSGCFCSLAILRTEVVIHKDALSHDEALLLVDLNRNRICDELEDLILVGHAFWTIAIGAVKDIRYH